MHQKKKKMLQPGLQILGVCGTQGSILRLPETWDLCRSPGLKALWILKESFPKGNLCDLDFLVQSERLYFTVERAVNERSKSLFYTTAYFLCVF